MQPGGELDRRAKEAVAGRGTFVRGKHDKRKAIQALRLWNEDDGARYVIGQLRNNGRSWKIDHIGVNVIKGGRICVAHRLEAAR